eukprot:TRINITY_DN65_c0_g1_i2.p1 TRINITY_DN65_c0_g1~~TRINITY_DN65_c0_g1_i2.p1  ORF type:complete len:286 (-),score=77.76 TRINITY_DN65_c0_g1_i2:323-1180(-)
MGAGLSGCGFGNETPGERSVRFELEKDEGENNPSPGRRRTNRSLEGGDLLQKRRKKKSTSLTSLSPEAVEAVALLSTSSQQLLDSLSEKSKKVEQDMVELLATLNQALEMVSSVNSSVDVSETNGKSDDSTTQHNLSEDDKLQMQLEDLTRHKDKKFIDINKTLAKIRQRKIVKQLVTHWEEVVPTTKPANEGAKQEPNQPQQIETERTTTIMRQASEKPTENKMDDDNDEVEDEDDDEEVPIETEYYERLLDIRESLAEIYESVETLAEIVVADATLSRGSQTL